jgi:hypothetical protein
LVAHGFSEVIPRKSLNKCVGKWVVGNDGGECLVAFAAVSFWGNPRIPSLNRWPRTNPVRKTPQPFPPTAPAKVLPKKYSFRLELRISAF